MLAIHHLQVLRARLDTASCSVFGNQTEAAKCALDAFEFSVQFLGVLSLACLAGAGEERSLVPPELLEGRRLSLGTWLRTIKACMPRLRALPGSSAFGGISQAVAGCADLQLLPACDELVAARNRFAHGGASPDPTFARETVGAMLARIESLPCALGFVSEIHAARAKRLASIDFSHPLLPKRTVGPCRLDIRRGGVVLIADSGELLADVQPWFFSFDGTVCMLDQVEGLRCRGRSLLDGAVVTTELQTELLQALHVPQRRPLPGFDATVVSVVPLVKAGPVVGSIPSEHGFAIEPPDEKLPGVRMATSRQELVEHDPVELLVWRRRWHNDLINGSHPWSAARVAEGFRVPYVMSVFLVRPTDPSSPATASAVLALCEPSAVGLDDSAARQVTRASITNAIEQIATDALSRCPPLHVRVDLGHGQFCLVSWANVVVVGIPVDAPLIGQVTDIQVRVQAIWSMCDAMLLEVLPASPEMLRAIRLRLRQLERLGATMSTAERRLLGVIIETSEVRKQVAAAAALV